MSRMKVRRLELEEAGAVLVYVALIIPVLFAAAAISVDVARWYVEVNASSGQRMLLPWLLRHSSPGRSTGAAGRSEAEALVEANGSALPTTTWHSATRTLVRRRSV